ncbi:MAG: DoxX family protein [Phycisphaeraceae bacterium]
MPYLRWLLFGGWMPGSVPAELILTAVRVFTGLSLALAHGLDKVRNPETIIGMAETMGAPLPTAAGWLSALAEFVGGILLALGLLTRPAALLICGNMVVAGVGWHVIHRGDPYGTMEPAFLFLALAALYLVLGSGRLGVDRFLRR